MEYAVTSVFQRAFDLITGNTTGEVPLLIFNMMEFLRYGITCFLLYFIPKKCGNLSCNLPKKISIFLFIPSLFILSVTEFVIFICNQIRVFNLLYVLERTSNLPILYENIDVAIIFIVSVIGLCINLIVVFGINSEIKQLLIGQQLQMQVNHYVDLEANGERIKRLRHDMKNHMITILELLDCDDMNNVKEYMNKLISESGLFPYNQVLLNRIFYFK